MWSFRRHLLFPVWLIALSLAVFSPGHARADDRRAPVAAPDVRAWESQAIDAIASLADPAKLATLAVRGANQRVQKITYWLLAVKKAGASPEALIDAAVPRRGTVVEAKLRRHGVPKWNFGTRKRGICFLLS